MLTWLRIEHVSEIDPHHASMDPAMRIEATNQLHRHISFLDSSTRFTQERATRERELGSVSRLGLRQTTYSQLAAKS